MSDKRIPIYHPHQQLDSDIHKQIGKVIAARNGWFLRGNTVVRIRNLPSGFEYSGDPEQQYRIVAYAAGLSEVTGLQARSDLEKYIVPTQRVFDNGDLVSEFPKSFSVPFCLSLMASDFLHDELLHISRILTVPLPFRSRNGNGLIYPKEGYDRQFGTYLVHNAPRIESMPLADALGKINGVLSNFPFTTEQSKCHAIARLLTPLARGFLGWTTRTPLWLYCANRPRAGKDYLAGITMIIYEGQCFEDCPIGKDSEETWKRLIAAARAGRRFMHFSNCQGYLEDRYLMQALTNPKLTARRLGSNEGSSDLQIPNEMEFSMSANIGFACREDYEPRIRRIELAFYEEDANSRVFDRPFLHKELLCNRTELLSALNAIIENWADRGFPPGETSFTSYPEWAETIGGIMLAAELGDPCQPFKGTFNVGSDRKTEAMTELFRACYQRHAQKWITKEQIFEAVNEESENGNDGFDFFGPLFGAPAESKKARTQLGHNLRAFKERWLDGIQLLIDESNKKTQHQKFGFFKP